MAKPKSKSKPKKIQDHSRLLPPKSAVVSFIRDIGDAKNRTSIIGKDVTEAAKLAKERGVNVPAARIAERIYKKAQNDAIQGRTLWEDIQFYLECIDFDKVAPAGMFSPDEVRSTKPKKNGRKAAQADTIEEQSEVLGGPHGDGEEEVVVH